MLVHHSHTRRKSCAECIRVKRRCDLVLPQCTRCSKRELTCRYGTSSKKINPERVETSPPVQSISNSLSSPRSVCQSPAIVEVTPLDSFNFPELAPISREHVDFTVGRFQGCITQLVQDGRLPFIHHTSYREDLPQVYQDLVGVSAMYCQKTPHSQRLVFSILDKSLSRLTASSNPWTFERLLLATQALIFYQIIRLFDADLRQRKNAERQLIILESWTNRLRQMSIECHDGLILDKSPYQHWVALESARRTVLVSVMLQAIYSLLRDGICSSVPLMATLPVSVDGRLWGLTEDDWWQATSGAETQLVTYREYMRKWSQGDSLQIDEYETILLIACQHNAARL